MEQGHHQCSELFQPTFMGKFIMLINITQYMVNSTLKLFYQPLAKNPATDLNVLMYQVNYVSNPACYS